MSNDKFSTIVVETLKEPKLETGIAASVVTDLQIYIHRMIITQTKRVNK